MLFFLRIHPNGSDKSPKKRKTDKSGRQYVRRGSGCTSLLWLLGTLAIPAANLNAERDDSALY
ncbi:MAG: hypothetical protein ACTS73_02955 [Arsenophonus sp. NEOnobi-MAG3]